MKKWTLIIIGIISAVALLNSSLYMIPAGTVGVIFDPLSGGVKSGETLEGLNVKAPYQSVDKYNIKTQEFTMASAAGETGDGKVKTVTNEGLYVGLDITILYKINPAMADEIRQKIGREGEYQAIVVKPEIRSTIREIVSNHSAVEVYGEGRNQVESEIQTALTANLENRGILVENVLLRDVELPTQLTKSIEQKKQAEQEALRMEYILQKESQEKDRKIIEAQGIAEANLIINQSLTGSYLTWYWIENLQNHESVVYMVPSDTGLPLFKNIDMAPETGNVPDIAPTVPEPVTTK